MTIGKFKREYEDLEMPSLGFLFKLSAIAGAMIFLIAAPNAILAGIFSGVKWLNAIPVFPDIPLSPPPGWDQPDTATTKTQDTGFDAAYQFTRQWEGGYVNHGADIGGETNFGVAAEFNPGVDVANLTPEKAGEIIRDKYWQAGNCGQYGPYMQQVCLDTVVMHGAGGWQEFISAPLPPDDKEAAIEVVKRRIAYRYQRVKERPDQGVFLKGWLNRDNALLSKITSTEVK
jgi:Glycosyl hydrolase 108